MKIGSYAAMHASPPTGPADPDDSQENLAQQKQVAITEDQIQEFLSDPKSRSIHDKVFSRDFGIDATSNGKIVRIWDCYGWEEYYRHDDLMKLVSKSKIRGMSELHRLNQIEELVPEDE